MTRTLRLPMKVAAVLGLVALAAGGLAFAPADPSLALGVIFGAMGAVGFLAGGRDG